MSQTTATTTFTAIENHRRQSDGLAKISDPEAG
jgi:hypothetical protein